MSEPRIVCIGSNLESEIALKGFVESGLPIAALITRPPGNKGSVSDYVDLHKFCKENNIETIDTTNVNDEECVRKASSLEADYLFTLGWSQIFSKNFINSFKKQVIGSHPTKLPEGRGRAPVPWTILLNKKSSAVSFFLIEDETVDEGKIILQKDFNIPDRAYAWDLYKIVAVNLRDGFLEIYKTIKNGENLESISQLRQGSSSEYAKRVAEDGKIDFNEDSNSVDVLIRAVSYPYPGACTFYKGEKIIITNSRLSERKDLFGLKGQIMKKNDKEILVNTGDGLIWLGGIRNEKGDDIGPDYFKLHDKLGFDVEQVLFQLKKENT